MAIIKQFCKSKKGISPMISYILLISFAVVMGTIVYQGIKTYIPSESLSLDCPEGVSLIVNDIVCENSQLNLTFKNKGRFDIDGYFIHATNDSNQELATIDLSELIVKGGEKISGAIKFPGVNNPLSPNNEIRNLFSLPFPIYSIEITPMRFEEFDNKKRLVSCKNSKIREKVSCSGIFKGTGGTSLPQGLVSWWRFEGNANDENGINDGTIFGANCNSAGKFDLACNFNGVSDYVSVPFDYSTQFLGSDPFTLSSWIKTFFRPTSTSDYIFGGDLNLNRAGIFVHFVALGLLYFNASFLCNKGSVHHVDAIE